MNKNLILLSFELIILMLLVCNLYDKVIAKSCISSISNESIVLNDKDKSNLITWGPKDKKIIAITFDDGPHPRHTPKILDLLDKYNIKATFFMLGKNAYNYQNLVKEVKKRGHEIGNHTYSHIDIRNTSKEKINDEIKETQDIINSIIDEKPKIFRPPFGYYNKNIIEIADQNGCKVILWSPNIDSKDWSNPGANHIIKTVLSKVENGDIILFHDYVPGQSDTLKALKTIIPDLQSKGYQFVTVSEIIQMLSTNNQCKD